MCKNYEYVGKVVTQSILIRLLWVVYLAPVELRNGLAISTRNASVDLSDYGLQTGDIITRFAGQSTVSGVPDIVAIRQAATSGRPVAIDLIRDGQPMTITIGSPS